MKVLHKAVFFLSCLVSTIIHADKIDSYVESEMKVNHIPGASLIVIKDGKIIKEKAYGLSNIELNVPTSFESIYQIGSIGKQFTAMLVMMQLEKGNIGLDDNISKYLKGTPEVWKNITIRHLLTHTSGIKNYDNFLKARQDYTDDELIKLIATKPLDFQPGTNWKYSNSGYMLLGIIVKNVTGKFYGDYLQEMVFNPLKMTSAGIVNARKIIPNRVAGYELVENQLLNQDYVSPSLSRTADGTLYMAAADLAKWDQALYTEKLLKKPYLNMIFTPFTLKNGKKTDYGFGWFIEDVNGHKLIEHGGEFQGFSSFISRYVDDKFTVILITNRAYIADIIGNMAHHIAGLYDPKLMSDKLITNKPK